MYPEKVDINNVWAQIGQLGFEKDLSRRLVRSVESYVIDGMAGGVQYTLDKDQERFLMDFGEKPQEFAGDPIDVVGQMRNFARERSHGAAVLSKVFLPVSLYNSMRDRLNVPNGAHCRVRDTLVLGADLVDKDCFIGICTEKFDNVHPDLLVVIARSSNANKN